VQLMARNQAFLPLNEPESGLNLASSPKKSLKKVTGYLTILKGDQAHTDSSGTFTAVAVGAVYEIVPYESRFSLYMD
jgi:hypothetical protein